MGRTAVVVTLVALFVVPATAGAEEVPRTVTVPVDHDDPDDGTFELDYALAGPWDPDRPTVLFVRDGQQFDLRIGRVAEAAATFFEDGLNVVGVPGRIAEPELVERVTDEDGTVDWRKAYRLFRSRQWCGDLEAVRRDVVGPDAPVAIAGGSGGGFLIQECLALSSEHYHRAFLEAAANPHRHARMGIRVDRFWEELDPDLRALARRAVARFPDDRAALMTALSRQHYFHTADELADARRELLTALAEGDRQALADARREYQVDAVAAMMATPEAVPVRVRLYEFASPAVRGVELGDDEVHPNLEMIADVAAPLLALEREGVIEPPSWDDCDLKEVGTEVLLLAGRWDEAVDWRTQVELARVLPEATLVMVDDDHMFKALKEAALFTRLVTTFLLHGADSEPMADLVEEARPHLWRASGDDAPAGGAAGFDRPDSRR